MEEVPMFWWAEHVGMNFKGKLCYCMEHIQLDGCIVLWCALVNTSLDLIEGGKFIDWHIVYQLAKDFFI
jgi:hypothetical protein